MNTFRIFIFSLLFTSVGTFAQGQGYSSNRDLQHPAPENKPTAEEINKSRAESVDKYMVKLKEALNLDELQEIAIRNEVLAHAKNVDIVMKKEDNQEDKAKEIKALFDKNDVTINSYLNKEQKEKYVIFLANWKNKKKDKKEKKSNKKTEE
jgi:hypothetical protein